MNYHIQIVAFVTFLRISTTTNGAGTINKLLQREEVYKLSLHQNPPNGRIANGRETTPYRFPWMVLIRVSGENVCGGTIINHHFILTAGHCLEADIDWIQIVAGEHNSRCAEGREQKRRVVNLRIHPLYRKYRSENDLGIAQVDPPFNFSYHVQPGKLAQYETECIGDVGITAGWGLLQYPSTELPDKLMEAVVPRRKNEDCLKEYSPHYYPDLLNCMGGVQSSCLFDSGGPVMLGRDFTVCGVHVERGMPCGNFEKPDVSTKVSYFKNWIQENSDINNPPPPQIIRGTCGGFYRLANANFILERLRSRLTCHWMIEAKHTVKTFKVVSTSFIPEDEIWVITLPNLCQNCKKPTRMKHDPNTIFSITGGSSVTILGIRIDQKSSPTPRNLYMEFTSTGERGNRAPITATSFYNAEKYAMAFPKSSEFYYNSQQMLGIISFPAAIGNPVKVTFNWLDIDGDSLKNCPGDHLSFFMFLGSNGFVEGGRFCGKSNPKYFKFSTGAIFMHFESSADSKFGRGFSLNYTLIK